MRPLLVVINHNQLIILLPTLVLSSLVGLIMAEEGMITEVSSGKNSSNPDSSRLVRQTGKKNTCT